MFRIKMMSKAIRFEGAALFKVEGLMTNMVGWGAESTSPHISAPALCYWCIYKLSVTCPRLQSLAKSASAFEHVGSYEGRAQKSG
jgi:hypothetical protein